MKKFDILISINGNLEWITDVYCDDVNEAITNAIQLVGKAKYVGHNEYKIKDGAWVNA